MKIAFILNMPFHLLSPFKRPVSEAEAAVCYISIELAKIGHDITIFSDTDKVMGAFGIRTRRIHIENQVLNLDKAILETDYDAIIVKNASPEFIISLRHAIPHQTSMYLWTSFDVDADINRGLHEEKEIAELAGIICVSDWQREKIIASDPIPHNKITTMQYAISPYFENLFLSVKELISAKTEQPALAYTAESLAGLEVMLEAFDEIHTNYPESTLTIYSGMHKYGTKEDQISSIYEKAKSLKGLTQVGSVSRVELAWRLRSKSILCLPTVESYTYNIDILEAMAAGVYVLTSNAGALPEYGHGLSKSVPVEELHDSHLDGYVSQALAICQTQVHSHEAFYDYCFKQVEAINEKHTWRVRARQLISLLTAKA